MSVLIVRHALSEANNRNNVGTLAFASMEAPLMEHGVHQAAELAETLRRDYSIDPENTKAAVSELIRTQQTASRAGFKLINRYAVLNEVAHGKVLPHLRGMLDQNLLPEEAIAAAHNVLETPPPETIWITHGLVIAGICKVLGIHQDKRLIPTFCEIREIQLS